MRIFSKIFISHVAIGLFSVLILSFLFYNILKNSLIQRTLDQLSSVNILKKNQMENYFYRTQKNLIFLFGRTDFLEKTDAIADIEKHKVYLDDHQKSELNNIGSLYDFDNIIIADNHLNSIYSLNTDTAFLKEFTLARADSLKALNKDFVYFDASIYDHYGQPVLLYIIPLHSKKDPLHPGGFIVIKEHFSKFQKILYERTGMGTTGESYLVASDKRMRSVSRFFPDSPPLKINVNSEAVSNVFKEKEGGHVLQDYRNVKVLSAYRKLNFDLPWAIISEIDYHEAVKPINQLKNYIIVITVVLILVILIVTYFISNAISNPILYLKDIIMSLSKGVVPESPIKSKGNDEIAQITEATRQLVEGTKRTTEFAHQTGAGNFDATFTTLSDEDTLGLALLSMRDKIKMLQEREVRLVREKASALLEGQENERKRFVRELHDGIGQLLTVVKLRLDAMDAKDKEKQEEKQEVLDLVNNTIGEVRRISYNVMPSVLVDFGLEAGLRGLCDNVKKYSRLNIEFTYIKETDKPLSFEVSVPVFRIVQEGLNNIIKHAKATDVYLDVMEQEEYLYLKLKDNGIGFNKADVIKRGGFGLTSMNERAKLLNGELHIESIHGEGTVTELEIPLNRE